jgi:glycosyltransferase involved in cell wall biosynthesis
VTQLRGRPGLPDEPFDASGGARQPRVALILATSTGGVGTHVADLAAGLAGYGAQVAVWGPAATNVRFCFDAAPDPVTGARSHPDGGRGTLAAPVKFAALEIAGGVGSFDVRVLRTMRRWLIGFAPDVVHAHGLRAGAVAALALPRRAFPLRRRAEARLLVTLHNAVLASGVRGGLARLTERWVARRADVILGASQDLVNRAVYIGAADARLGPVAAPRLAPPRHARSAVRAELGVAADQLLILSVGRLHTQKRYDVLVRAAARWRDRPGCPAVVIAGDGPERERLTGEIAVSGAPVSLLGHRDDVADLLAAADLAVVTSDWEARQLFAQEALRAGVALVATAVGGIPELVGDAAVLVPAGDVDSLDRAVWALLDDPAARDRYAALGRARSATWPTGEQVVAQIWEVYRELIERPGSGGRA